MALSYLYNLNYPRTFSMALSLIQTYVIEVPALANASLSNSDCWNLRTKAKHFAYSGSVCKDFCMFNMFFTYKKPVSRDCLQTRFYNHILCIWYAIQLQIFMLLWLNLLIEFHMVCHFFKNVLKIWFDLGTYQNTWRPSQNTWKLQNGVRCSISVTGWCSKICVLIRTLTEHL